MARCEDCIHEKLCVIKAFPDAFENTAWDKEPCDHFKYSADVAPMKECGQWILCEERLPKETGEYLVKGTYKGDAKTWKCQFLSRGVIRGWCNNATNPIVSAWWEPADVVPKSEVEFWKHQCFHACMNNGCLDVVKIKENLSYGHPDPAGEPGVEGEPGMLDCTYWRMRYAEVVREIFEEIEKLFERFDNITVDGEKARWDMIPVRVIKYSDFEELKKKYTEK